MFILTDAEMIKTLPGARVEGGAAFCPGCGKALLQLLPGGGGVVVWCKKCKTRVRCPVTGK